MRKAHNSKLNIQQLQRYNLAQAMSRVKGNLICKHSNYGLNYKKKYETFSISHEQSKLA